MSKRPAATSRSASLPLSDDVDLVPVLAEPGAERVAHDRLVVDDQDPQVGLRHGAGGAHHFSPASAGVPSADAAAEPAAGASGCLAGSRIVNVVPRPGSDSTSIVPWWPFTIP